MLIFSRSITAGVYGYQDFPGYSICHLFPQTLLRLYFCKWIKDDLFLLSGFYLPLQNNPLESAECLSSCRTCFSGFCTEKLESPLWKTRKSILSIYLSVYILFVMPTRCTLHAARAVRCKLHAARFELRMKSEKISLSLYVIKNRWDIPPSPPSPHRALKYTHEGILIKGVLALCYSNRRENEMWDVGRIKKTREC